MWHYFKDYTRRPAIYVSFWNSFHHITASVQQASLVNRPQPLKGNSKVNTENILNIVQPYNAFSPLHYTAVFETFKFSFFLSLFRGQIRKSEMCFRHCCDVHWMDFQPLVNTDALVLSSGICVITFNHLTAHKHTHTQTQTHTHKHTHTHTYIYIYIYIWV